MIIRLFSIPLLLALASAAQADALYRWIEADGSITFSPKKPPSGVEYQVIGGDAKSAAQTGQINAASASRSQGTALSGSELDRRSVDASVSWMNPAEPGSQGSNNVEPPFAAARPAVNPSSSRTQRRPAINSDVSSVASSNKRSRQCIELGMRVTSLEERMKARLSPEAMDRTVMSMARYQQSLDRFCS